MPVRILLIFLVARLATLSITSFGQPVIVQAGVNLPPDKKMTEQLLADLNALLDQRDNPNNTNTCVLQSELLATSALLDEMKAIEHSTKPAQKNAYQPYLTNVIAADSSHFTVQLAYMGISNSQPALQAIFNLKAFKQGNRFYFYSPLNSYTQSWHTKILDNITFRFKEALNQNDAKAYQQTVSRYDKKLHAPHEHIVLYYANDFTEVQQLLGIAYKAAYNSQKYNNLTAHERDTTLVINGWNDEQHRFDPHDLWHERLRTVMKPELINRPVDEGCAYLYGGSWGYTWPEIISKFKVYANTHPDANWLQLYLDGTNFEPAPKTLKISYVLNALLVQKVEREKGFDAVKPLLGCGPKEQGDENYFKALNTITGITKASFNIEVQKLIAQL